MRDFLKTTIKDTQLLSAVLEYLSSKGKSFVLNNKYLVLPGLCDVHVHFREPGFCYKETIETGSACASAGGYTCVLTMPNLNPAPDCLLNLSVQLEAIKKSAKIHVIPYGTITVGEKGEKLSDMEKISNYVCAFSDDGRGVQNEELMYEAMLKAKELGKIIVAHCEVNSLLNGGYIHDGEYAKRNGHKGICSESEFLQIKRDLELVKKTGVKYHVCHISTKESVEIIRQAKKEGLDVTCETAPHYLVLSDSDLQESGNFKMNPPIRAEEDRLALIEGILDGTIDMIATDHAPHSIEEKSKGLKDSVFGVVGLETAFSVIYTDFVKTGIISLEKLVEIMCYNPRRRFSLNIPEGFTVFEIENEFAINPETFLSKGKSTPFNEKKVYGKCVLTVLNDKIVYQM